jgi:hypothetical protein
MLRKLKTDLAHVRIGMNGDKVFQISDASYVIRGVLGVRHCLDGMGGRPLL